MSTVITTTETPVIATARVLQAAMVTEAAAIDADIAARLEIIERTGGFLHQTMPPRDVLDRLLEAQDARRLARFAFEDALADLGLDVMARAMMTPEAVLSGMTSAEVTV